MVPPTIDPSVGEIDDIATTIEGFLPQPGVMIIATPRLAMTTRARQPPRI
jgi:hypothetical protein